MSDSVGRISFWPKEAGASSGAPAFTGTLNIGDTKYRVSLWNNGNQANDKAPVLTGEVESDVRKPSG